MSRLDFPPSKFEVVEQMTRILASRRFVNAPNPSKFLELAVMRAVKGKKTTGSIIARNIFGDRFIPGVSPDVRVTAGNLRKLLAKYYGKEGSDDAVFITFAEPEKDKSIKPPKGEAYTPHFSYNPSHHSFVDIVVGYACLEKSTYGDYSRALQFFDAAFVRDSENIGACLGLVETICNFAHRGWVHPSVTRPFEVGLEILSRVEPRAKAYWRFWAIKADLHHHFETDESAIAFYHKAFLLDRSSVESFMPYIEFLVHINKWDEAIVLIERYVKSRFEDTNAVARYASILFMIQRVDDGEKMLQWVLQRDPTNCMAHEMLALFRLVRKDAAAVSEHLRVLRALCDAPSFERIVGALEGVEEQFGLKGYVGGFLSESASVSSVAIVKP